MVKRKADDRESVLHSAETELINHLKQLSSLPTQPPKKNDPIARILQKYINNWRAVKK
ncbi:MAG: hypothetical protein JSW11_21470 [Candidatus Heimdallarchaeota archaeon]|nr:MAG: hypothetical protein JSW11_21470 [Candidatus Heimdallarchaeota archaeon]